MRTNKRDWAKMLLQGIERTKVEAKKDKRANASYWNADDWGSLQGFKDAEEFVQDELIEFIIKNAQPVYTGVRG